VSEFCAGCDCSWSGGCASACQRKAAKVFQRPEFGRTGIVSAKVIVGRRKLIWGRSHCDTSTPRAATLDSPTTRGVEMALKRKATDGATAAAQKKSRTGMRSTNDVVPFANDIQQPMRKTMCNRAGSRTNPKTTRSTTPTMAH
jgi:hypothetical protein